MTTIRCTRALASKLHIKLPDQDPSPPDSTSWYANVFRFDRKQYILATNESTLVSITFPARGMTSPDVFADVLRSNIVDYFRIRNWSAAITTLGVSADVRFLKARDRRILGSMTDLMFQARFALEQNPGDIDIANRFLNRNPLMLGEPGAPEDRIQRYLQ